MFQSLVNDQVMSESTLWKDTPEKKIGDFDYLLDVIDWDLNLDPNFREHRFMLPRPVKDPKEMESEGYHENWIMYKSKHFSAKELIIYPESSVTIEDSAAYGMIMMQGNGSMGEWDIETPTLIRYDQLIHNEFFISESAAKEDVRITNPSKSDPIVMLKHFGPENPDLRL
jgi:hypothetical protein